MATQRTRRDFGSVRQIQPSERWQASFLNPQDRTRRINAPTTYRDKRDAEAWLNDERRLIELGTWTDPRAREAAFTTLEEYGREWLKHHQVRDSTRALYRDRLEDLVFPFLGRHRLQSLTTSDIRVWHRARREHAATRSLETAYTALRSMLSTALEDEIIDRNPCTLRGVYSTTTKRQARAVSASELALISSSIRPGYEALVLIAGWCGLRWGEVVGLRRRDVDLENGQLAVFEAIGVRRGDRLAGATRAGRPHVMATFVRTDVKTSGSRRIVDIPPHIIPAIRHHLDTYVDMNQEALLFTAARSKERPVSGSTFHAWFKAALELAGVEPMRVHELRHTAATLAMQTGQASGFDVMARIGHTSPKTAARYQHVGRQRQRDLAVALSEMAAREDSAVAAARSEPGFVPRRVPALAR